MGTALGIAPTAQLQIFSASLAHELPTSAAQRPGTGAPGGGGVPSDGPLPSSPWSGAPGSGGIALGGIFFALLCASLAFAAGRMGRLQLAPVRCRSVALFSLLERPG